MSLNSLRLWTQTRCSTRVKQTILVGNAGGSRRKYVTQHNMDFGGKSQLLSELDTKRRSSEAKHDNVGPFQLGLSQSALHKGEKPRKWSELSTSGKVMRTTARTSNLGVILLGAGLSALLVYSLTTELFSKNSPTVLYGEACEKIEKSARISKYLNGPLTFHNNPPSSVRPRHRNRHVTSRVMVDSYGQEHMIMTFYVQGRPEGEQPTAESSYFESISNFVKDAGASLQDLSFDEAIDWTKETGQNIWDKSVRAFKYLSGSPLPPTTYPPIPPSETQEREKKQESTSSKFFGVFSSFKGPRKENDPSLLKSSGRQYTEGEVHADLVKNANGYFVFRYLLVDIPNSRDYNPIRVFVERQDGVRENEPVMRWIS